MRLAQIENGVVVNVIEADPRPDWADGWPEAGDAAPGWIETDGVLVPPDAPAPPVPELVSAFQARAALLAAGLLDDAEAAVLAVGGQTDIAWEYAVEFRRDSPTIATLGAQLGLTAAQIDDLFRAAALIIA